MHSRIILLLANAALVFAGVVNIASPKKTLEITITNVKGTTVESIDDVVLLAKVTNTGDEPVHVVKYGGVIDGGYTRSFIVKKDGEEIKFLGVLAQLAITYDDEEIYSVIAPGETITTEHRLAALYDFASAGTGNFTFEPLIVTRGVDANRIVDVNSFAGPSDSVSVNITDDVSNRPLVPSTKRAINLCQASQRAFVDASYQESRWLAGSVNRDTGSQLPGSPGSPLFRAYFKTNPLSVIGGRFAEVDWDESAPSRTLGCDDPLGVCSGQVIAYTIIATTNIHFCSIFFNQVDTNALCTGTSVNARNIRGGTVLHEVIHANSIARGQHIIDLNYGCPGNQALSAYDQARNADNYNCYATALHQAEYCPKLLKSKD